MSNIEITADLTDNYSTQFKKIETFIHDLGVILNQKNLDDLIWVLPRIDSFKNIYHDNFLDEIIEDLKAKKLGKSFNEITLYIAACYVLKNIESIIKDNIIDNQTLTINDWIINKEDFDFNDKSDIYYNLNKFIIWTYLEVQSLLIVWDKKDLDTFPISDFVQYQTMTLSLLFKNDQDVLNYIVRNKEKTRINLFKLQIIFIESSFRSAKSYLKDLSQSSQ
jgi:hypothetical protein